MPARKRSSPEAGTSGCRPYWRRIVERLPPVLGLALLLFGGIALRRELRELDLRKIGDDLAAISTADLATAVGCTLLSYFILSFYDRLAVIHVGRKLSFGRTAFAAFCSYVLSHNLGFAAISGAAVRFRLYGNWGLRPGEITRIVAFCSVTYGLGASTLAAIVLLGEPGALGALSHRISPVLLRGMGLGFAAVVLGYVAVSFRMTTVRLGRMVLPLPGPRMACGQILVATLEVAATAAIAYSLLPSGTALAFPAFLALYLASYSAGLAASVPGGLGVFDGAMVLGLSPFVDTATAIVTILVFRLLYYIIPLFVAGLLFAGHELLLRGDALWSRRKDAPARSRPSGVVRESEADFSVTVAAAIVVLDAATLLGLRLFRPASPIAFALPPPADPFLLGAGLGLADYLTRAARVAGSIVPPIIGSVLAGLAIGLSQRVTLAWSATLASLALGAAAAALAGAPIVVPGILLLSILVIAPFRSSYYRHARVLSEPLAPATVVPLFLLLGCILILYRAQTLSGVRSGAPLWMSRLLPSPFDGRLWFPATLALAVGLVAIARLVLPGRVGFRPWDEAAAGRFRAMAARAEDAPQSRWTHPDGVVFGENNRSAIAFRRFGRVLLALGDPVGALPDRVSAIWRLRDLAIQERRQPAFCRVGGQLLDVYNDLGLQAWPMEDGTLLCCHAESGPALRRLVQRLDRAEQERSGNGPADDPACD